MKSLLAHFDRLAEAPGAVPRLRRFILDLAVRGKLVEQHAGDEPAAELLNRIRNKESSGRQPPQIAKSTPHPLPQGWHWERFDTVAAIKSNLVDPSDYPDLPHIAPDNIESGTGRLLPYDTVRASGVVSSKHLFSPGCILYSKIRPALAKAVTADFEGLCSADMYPIQPFISREYLHCYMLSETFVRQSISEDTRVAMPKINQAALSRILVPVAPLAEQQRIALRVDELMALCDRLEAAQAERERRRDRLVAASARRLGQPVNAEIQRQDACVQLARLREVLTHRPHIDELRRTILKLAVRGQIVTQDSSDPPAPTVEDVGAGDRDKLEMRLPSNWSWVRVANVAEARLGKMLDKRTNSGRLRPYLRNTNVHWFDVRVDDLKTLRLEDDEVETYLLRKGDVLICEGGHGIGRSAVWRSEVPDVVFQKALHRIRPGSALNGDFFSYCISVYFHAGVLQRYFTGVGIPHFTGRALSMVVFPLPPLAEQHRIVAKVDELMAICDRLEATLETTETESRRFLEAVLHQALAVA